MEHVLRRIEELRVIPMVAIDDAKDAVPLAEALAGGGLPCVEITFRTDAAHQAIRNISRLDDVLLGAGTVLTVEHAKKAIDGGVHFIVTPGFSAEVVQYCIDSKIPIFPGTSTPSDLQAALGFGIKVVKFFPAEAFGGLKTLKAISAPYGMMRFVPTGGINTDNLAEYLAFPKVVACGGSWLAKSDMISEGNFAEITRLAEEAVRIAASV